MIWHIGGLRGRGTGRRFWRHSSTDVRGLVLAAFEAATSGAASAAKRKGMTAGTKALEGRPLLCLSSTGVERIA